MGDIFISIHRCGLQQNIIDRPKFKINTSENVAKWLVKLFTRLSASLLIYQ